MVKPERYYFYNTVYEHKDTSNASKRFYKLDLTLSMEEFPVNLIRQKIRHIIKCKNMSYFEVKNVKNSNC